MEEAPTLSLPPALNQASAHALAASAAAAALGRAPGSSTPHSAAALLSASARAGHKAALAAQVIG
jgi:hypothetical protein